MTQGNSATGPQADSLYKSFMSMGSSYANMKPTFRHMGGNFKPGQNYVVGEYGPEMMKAFPRWWWSDYSYGIQVEETL